MGALYDLDQEMEIEPPTGGERNSSVAGTKMVTYAFQPEQSLRQNLEGFFEFLEGDEDEVPGGGDGKNGSNQVPAGGENSTKQGSGAMFELFDPVRDRRTPFHKSLYTCCFEETIQPYCVEVPKYGAIVPATTSSTTSWGWKNVRRLTSTVSNESSLFGRHRRSDRWKRSRHERIQAVILTMPVGHILQLFKRLGDKKVEESRRTTYNQRMGMVLQGCY